MGPKVPKKFDKNWNFYLRHIDLPDNKFTFCGTSVEILDYDEKGFTAKQVFFILDSTGETLPCKEPALLRKVIVFKKSLNFHIKMWIEGYEDMGTNIDDYMLEFDDPPDWVRKSFRNQLKKKMVEIMKKLGII